MTREEITNNSRGIAISVVHPGYGIERSVQCRTRTYIHFPPYAESWPSYVGICNRWSIPRYVTIATMNEVILRSGEEFAKASASGDRKAANP